MGRASALAVQDLIGAVGLEDAVGPSPQGLLVSRADTFELLIVERSEPPLTQEGFLRCQHGYGRSGVFWSNDFGHQF
ncbi:hypothetical protein CKO08_10565 [Halorhodospira halochloris]|nr:hypothetical protein [Halorhodospira halochloris]